MLRSAAALALAFILAGWPFGAAALQRSLSLRDIDEALAIGQTRIAAERARFHQPYRFTISTPPVDYLDVVTPFRRVVLAAESRAQLGDRGFGQREARELIAGDPARVDVVVELTFHPQNTYVGVPEFQVALLDGTRRLDPRALERVPRFTARVAGGPLSLPLAPGAAAGSGQPILGATLVASFDAAPLAEQGVWTFVVRDEGRLVVQRRLDFQGLR